jgi:adenylate cyclase
MNALPLNKKVMDDKLRSRIKNWLVSITAFTVLFNSLGGTLVFVYFTFIESGLFQTPTNEDLNEHIAFFLKRLALIMGVAAIIGWRQSRPIRKKLGESLGDLDQQKLRALVGDLMSMPYNMAFLSAVGWMVAVALFSYRPSSFSVVGAGPWEWNAHIIVGILFVGAPFTVMSVYFALEWAIRKRIAGSFPVESLLVAPRSRTVSVLKKMVVVLLVMGTVPVSTVSYITLSQICAIQANKLQISSFVSQMPLVIAFFLFVAVVAGVVLSALLAKSVSRPLRQTAEAMELVRQGDLDVRVPVLSNDEIGTMGEGFNRMVEGLRERDFIRETFGSYLSPDVVANILRSPEGVNLGGELREVTILVSDLRGFTSLTAARGPEVVLRILNMYLEAMVDIIMSCGGTIDEFTGDGILAFFGAPRHVRDSQERAVQCAMEMQKCMPELNERLRGICPVAPGSEAPVLEMGIAINSGTLIVGNIGSERRKKYGAVGTAINVAFRIEKRAAAGEIIITADVYEKVLRMVDARSVQEVKLKGIDGAVTLYSVLGTKEHPAAEAS